MIDLHILTVAGREDRLQCALASADYPTIQTHVLGRNTDGDVNAGRVAGYALGSNPYVACLDDDDELTCDLSEAIEALENDPALAGTYYDELRIDENDNQLGPGFTYYPGPWSPVRHLCGQATRHIAVLRRDALAPRLHEIGRFKTRDLMLANSLVLDYGPLKHIEKVGYHWRMHSENAHNHYPYHNRAARRAVVQHVWPTV